MPVCASMVTGFLILDKEHFSLEQTISILLVNHCERWTGVLISHLFRYLHQDRELTSYSSDLD